MPTGTSRLWLAALGLLTGACALAGYDFGDYERASVTSSPAVAGTASLMGSGGASGTSAIATSTPSNLGGHTSSAGHPAGGDATAGFSGGEAGASGGDAGAQQGPTPIRACEPRSCFALGLVCGPAPSGDGCGQPLDCGLCFWWFQECVENRCEIPE